MSTMQLRPRYDGARSFYKKAFVIHAENALVFLQSYDTIVCSLTKRGEFARHWNNYSRTTMRHINEFRKQVCGMNGITGGEWKKMPVFAISQIIDDEARRRPLFKY